MAPATVAAEAREYWNDLVSETDGCLVANSRDRNFDTGPSVTNRSVHRCFSIGQRCDQASRADGEYARRFRPVVDYTRRVAVCLVSTRGHD